MNVQVGQIYESTDKRRPQTVTVGDITDNGTVAVVTESKTGKTAKLQASRLTPKGHWRLVTKSDGGAVLEDPALADEPAFAGDDAVMSNQLVAVGAQFMLDSVGLSLPRGTKPPILSFEHAFERLGAASESINYYIGDLVNLGESLYGEEAAQMIDDKHLDEKSVRTYAWVCKRVQDTERRVAQSFSHAQVVAALGREDQRKWLEKSRGEDWSVSKLKFEVQAASADGKSKIRYLLIVDCPSESKQNKVAEELEADGLVVLKKQAIKKVVKPKKEKKGPVTAKRKGPTKMSATKRVPSGGPKGLRRVK